MNRAIQQEFVWPDDTPAPEGAVTTSALHEPATVKTVSDTATLASLKVPEVDPLPIARPLQNAVDQGVFGVTTDGPINPDENEVRAMTEEHGRELVSRLADLQVVEDSLRTGEDPQTGRTPKSPEASRKLREHLDAELPRLKAAYAAALEAFARGFGDSAASALDAWARKTVADCTIEPKDRYDPGHPWHYLLQGDNAQPIPIELIEPDLALGQFIERDLPKNPAKRREKLRALLAEEEQRVTEDKRRYQEIVEKGAEALSRYDREIAHTSDEMARATALSLKFNHLRYGLGRIAWMRKQLGVGDALLPTQH
ncbi:MAG: hypothetical protein DCC65_10645 [Planctomycetota bacterium]|nr:MAG: hypothetical protein DCC65_10645 [Planctomycetota bacterium]